MIFSSVLLECLERERRLRLISRDGDLRRERARERDRSRLCEMDLECSRDLDRLFDFALDLDLYVDWSVSVFSLDSSDLSMESDFVLLDRRLSCVLVDFLSSLELLSLTSDLRLEDRDFLLSESLLESRLSFLENSELLSSLLLFRLCFFSVTSTLLELLFLQKKCVFHFK